MNDKYIPWTLIAGGLLALGIGLGQALMNGKIHYICIGICK